MDELIKRDTKGLTEKQKFVIRQCQDKYKNGEQITTEFIENLKKGYETLKTASGSADQNENEEGADALTPDQSSNVGQLPDEADPFADVPLPEPPPLPSDWYDDS